MAMSFSINTWSPALSVGVRLALVAIVTSLTLGPQAGNAQTAATTPEDAKSGAIYGRVSTEDGTVYQGRLRWGADEEAYWGEYFNGRREGNPWAEVAPEGALRFNEPVRLLGLSLGNIDRRVRLDRPFMARFGDIARIDTRRTEFRVTLKSGSVHDMDRFESDDLADGVQIWDESGKSVYLDEWSIRSIEFLETPVGTKAPERLYGSVTTRLGSYIGYLRWNREQGSYADSIEGSSGGRYLTVKFNDILSIERDAQDRARIALTDGDVMLIEGNTERGFAPRGVYVYDSRYGRVSAAWDEILSVRLGTVGTGPGYDDFPPGLELTGSVRTIQGEHLTGRIVYDLDESETTETLDAPLRGLDFSIPFGLIRSINLEEGQSLSSAHANVELHSGEVLQLERAGDLADSTAGVLVFEKGRTVPHHVPFSVIAELTFAPR
ncbi:MAG: hypothetical protein HKN29_13660 [Rhodothermales bacterium]|nr:hypothetical protein [Rhodothermales bacterium]